MMSLDSTSTTNVSVSAPPTANKRLSYGKTMSLNTLDLKSQIADLLGMQECTIVVFDQIHEYAATSFSSVIGANQRILLYEYHNFYAFLGLHMKWVLEITTLEKIRRELNFLIICTRHCIQSVMDYVTNLDNTIGLRSLLRHFSTWLILSLDHHPPDLTTNLDNMAFLWLNFKCSEMNLNNGTILQYASITCDEKYEKGIWNYSKVDMCTLLWMPRGREWSPVDLQRVSGDSLYTTVFHNTKRGLNRRQLVLSTMEWSPYAHRHVDNGTVSYHGAGIDVMNNLGRKFNFSYVIVEPSDMLWGKELENGSYTGVAGMIARGDADACPVPYLMSQERKLFMDFSTQVDGYWHVAMYRKGSDGTYSWLYLMSSLSGEVYLCGLAALLWILLLFICTISQWKDRRVIFGTRHFSAYFEILTRISFSQDIQIIPEHISSKALLLTWCIFCMAMTTIYTCNRVAFVTVDKHQPPFNTLRELAEQSEYKVGINEGTYPLLVLKNTEDLVNKMLYKKINIILTTKGENFSTEARLNDTLKRMREEKFAIIASEKTKATLVSKTCDIVTMKERFFPANSGYVFPLHSPLKKLFNKQLSLLLEMGLMDRLIEKWTSAPMQCHISKDVLQFNLDHLRAILVTCAVGILMAAIVLLIEIWKVQKKNQDHDTRSMLD